MAHELGHIKHNDSFRRIIPMIISIASFILLGYFIPFGFAWILALGVEFMASVFFRRRSESQADQLALTHLSDDEKMQVFEKFNALDEQMKTYSWGKQLKISLTHPSPKSRAEAVFASISNANRQLGA